MLRLLQRQWLVRGDLVIRSALESAKYYRTTPLTILRCFSVAMYSS